MENQKIYDENIIFINRSDYSQEEFFKINVIVNKRFAKSFLFTGLFVLICDLIIIAASIMDGFKKSELVEIISFGALSIFFICFYFFIPLLLKRNKNIQTDMHYEYLFYDDHMQIDLNSSRINASEKRNYNDIKYAIEKEGYLFIYITRAQAYILKKDVNYDKLIEFLKSKSILVK